jgi:hypothetical protein
VKPSVGRIVHVLVDPDLHQGTDILPAIVTRVYEPGELDRAINPKTGLPVAAHPDCAVNLRVFHDGDPAEDDFMMFVAVHLDRASAEAAHEEALSFIPQPERERFAPRLQRRAFWPPREPADNSPQVQVSADLSPQQLKQITEMVQAALLQQAKRGRRSGI